MTLNTQPPYCDCPPNQCAAGCPPRLRARCQGVDERVPAAHRYAESYALRISHGLQPPDGQLAAITQAERRFLAKRACRHERDAGYPPGSCACPAMVPIYHCDKHDCRCSSLRQLEGIRYCGSCTDRACESPR